MSVPAVAAPIVIELLPVSLDSVPQPAAYSLTTQSSAAVYGTGTYGTSVYGARGIPIVRQSVEGSGFTVVIRVEDSSANPPITLKGFELEFTPGARM